MMWVKYQIDASIPMYEQLPVNTESKAREIFLARNPGIKHCSINRTFTGINPPEWWPGEKEKKEAKRQEENRRREDERRARRDEEQRREAKRQEENRRREAERSARRAEERHKSENDKLRREMENLRKENRDIARKSRQSSGEFWSESQYENFTDRAREQKDGMYEKIMNCQTNILTAPLKLICWLLHEIFNPHSFFRRHVFSVVNIILVLAGCLAYKNELMMFVILCTVSVVVNCIIGMKTDRSGIALLVVFIEAAIFGVAIWMTQPQISSFVHLNGIGYINQERTVATKSQQGIDKNLFKKLSSRQFDESELSSYTKSELRMMRNSIFARYGYRFKSEKIYCASLEERI